MIRPPAFWRHDGSALWPALLAPAAAIVTAAARRRARRSGWRAPVPVICCGNVTVGGSGKTTLALDLAARLLARGRHPHLLTRGYGGRVRGVLRVDPARHDATLVGDEALLLAAAAPTWVARDRAAAARAAIAAGADLLVMDDGLQNPDLAKDLAFLLIDGPAGFGNGRVLPAGPLREPIGAAASRASAAILIGPDATGARGHLPPGLPLLEASLVPGHQLAALAGNPVLAFAGIGRPEKFFAMLEDAGAKLVARHGFADHHPYRPAELAALLAEAASLGAIPVTTPKDAARIGAARLGPLRTVGVALAWRDEAEIEDLLTRILE